MMDIQRFRTVAILEGISYLLLLFVAMPVKYILEEPMLVLYIGWVHGFLFVLYCVFLAELWLKKIFTLKESVIAFLLSLLPFGAFYVEVKQQKKI